MNDRMETILNSLIKIAKNSNKTSMESDVNPLVIKCSDGRITSGIRKTIPRKNLNRPMKEEEKNKIFLFFGRNVKLEIKETARNNCYILNVKIKKSNDWKHKIGIFRGKINDNIDENKIYNIAIGHLEFYNNHPQIKTETISSILYREVK